MHHEIISRKRSGFLVVLSSPNFTTVRQLRMVTGDPTRRYLVVAASVNGTQQSDE
jgi:hypothetical protein